MVGGSCLWSPAKTHFGTLNKGIQQLASKDYRTVLNLEINQIKTNLSTLIDDNNIKVIFR